MATGPDPAAVMAEFKATVDRQTDAQLLDLVRQAETRSKAAPADADAKLVWLLLLWEAQERGLPIDADDSRA